MPHAARIKDDYIGGCDDLPLHSVLKDINFDVIELLVNAYPDAVFEKK